MTKVLRALLSFVFFITPLCVFGQMGLEGLSSGRYEIRKSSPPANKAVTKKRLPTAVTEPVVVKSSTEPKAEVEQAESPLSIQGGNGDAYGNKMEIDIFPSLTRLESYSNSAYRTFTTSYNSLNLKAKVWLTRQFGLGGRFGMSVAGDLESADKTTRHPTRFESMEFELAMRNFLDSSSSSYEVALLYSDDKINVENSAISRMKLESSGFGVGLKSRFLTSNNYAWTAGVKFFPRLKHAEQRAGFDVGSGAPGDSSRVTLSFGGEFIFDRSAKVFWDVGMSSEKDIFDGVAREPNPGSAVPASGVGVDTTTYVFSLGYRWGK